MDTLTNDETRRDTTGRVVRGPLHWTPPEAPQKNWWALVGGPLSVLIVLAILSSNIQLPYVALAPGGADPINQLLSVPKDKAYPPKGSFLLTTVSLETIVRPYDFVRDWFDDNYQLIAKKDLLGGSSEQQYNREAQQDMTDSKQAAVVLAFRTLGYTVTEHGQGALITGIASGDVPARGVLEAGDAITAADGTPTLLATDLVTVLQKHKFNDTLNATVQKADGSVVQKTLKLGSRTADNSTCTTAADTGNGPCLGIGLGTKAHKFDLPFDVKIDTTGIGGPSAGLAFTLALIDDLTPGELTGGRNVAVTGTIDIDGHVGEVGGVVQKTAAVRAAHAKLFLVPPGEFADASKHAGKDLKVVKVTTLNDALAALAANGGDVPKLAGQSPGN